MFINPISATRAAYPSEAHVQRFCRELSPGHEPELLTISEEPGAEPLDCFNNVRRLVERQGGEICFGWAIWEWPKVFIEAEHHAVYRDTRGKLHDLTPSIDAERSRLFLPDPSAVNDFNNPGIAIDNVRQALVDDPLITEFFEVATTINDIKNSIPGFGMVAIAEDLAVQLIELDRRKLALAQAIGKEHTPRNARCFCGSGKKFKRCCGRS